MNRTAKTLNEIIELIGFGAEFDIDDLIEAFPNPDTVIDELLEHDLLEKNPITNKYYLTDIFTCNSFLTQHLTESEDKRKSNLTVREFERHIRKNDLIDFLAKLKGYEKNITKIEINANDDVFDVKIKIRIEDRLLDEFKAKLV